MEHADGVLGLLIARHGDKTKTTGLAAHLVLHDDDIGDRTGLTEVILQIEFHRVERDISDVEFIGHELTILNC